MLQGPARFFSRSWKASAGRNCCYPAGEKDVISLKADDNPDSITIMLEDVKADRVSGDCASPFKHKLPKLTHC
jgi:hypothetical protein